jgi:hypothetical protein
MIKTLLIAIFAIVLANPLKAEAEDYDIPATGCVPTAMAISNNWYMWIAPVGTGASQPGVTHIPNSTASVTLHCPITQPFNMNAPGIMRLSYTDNSSTFQNNVSAYYKKVHKSTGVQTLITVLSTQTCGLGTGTCSTAISDVFDPWTYRYYVEVTLQRTNAANTLVFWGVSVI